MIYKRCIGFLVVTLSLAGCSTLSQVSDRHDPLNKNEHVALANTYVAPQQRALAAQHYQAALAQDKRCVPALVSLGNMAFEDRDLKKARSYFQRALKAAPHDPAIMNNL